MTKVGMRAFVRIFRSSRDIDLPFACRMDEGTALALQIVGEDIPPGGDVHGIMPGPDPNQARTPIPKTDVD
jgi:hypothetical protein